MRQLYTIRNQRVVQADADDATIEFYTGLTEDERRHLVSDLEIDNHTINSALDPDELSRIEFDDAFTTLIVKKPRTYTVSKESESSAAAYDFKVTSLGIFVFADKVIVVGDNEIPILSDRRFSRLSSQKAFVLQLVGYCIYHFMDHLRIISQVSNELENKISLSMENKYLLFMFSLSKGLVYYLDAINTNGMLLRRMTNNQRLALSEAEAELLEDISIDNQQCYRSAEIYSSIVSNMMDARASIVNNNLNSLMKTLNIITIGIMVPTFVVSAFSMNVDLPFDLKANPWAFWLILGMAVASLILFFIDWKRRKW